MGAVHLLVALFISASNLHPAAVRTGFDYGIGHSLNRDNMLAIVEFDFLLTMRALSSEGLGLFVEIVYWYIYIYIYVVNIKCSY